MEAKKLGVRIGISLANRIRRNHGLEHATLNILAQHFAYTSMAGHSDPGGFWILGDIPTEGLQDAVAEALARLHAGERGLALHVNCGTNFVTAGMLAGLAGSAAMLGAGRRLRDKLERLPVAISLATLALIVARPLGFLIQEKLTTSGDLGQLEVVKIFATRRGWVRAHRILTRG